MSSFFFLPKCVFFFFLLPSFFPHQKVLNQFHALQMLFTLLGVKHLLFVPLGFLSFFLLADSLCLFFYFPDKRRLHKDPCCRPAPGVRTVDCSQRASKKKKKKKKKLPASIARDVAMLCCSFPQYVFCIQ